MHATIKQFGQLALSLVTLMGMSLLVVPAAQAKKALGDGTTLAMIADNPISAQSVQRWFGSRDNAG